MQESKTVREGWPWGPTRFEERFGNGITRVVFAIFGIPILLGAMYLGQWWLLVLSAVLAVGMTIEATTILGKSGDRTPRLLPILLVLLLFGLYTLETFGSYIVYSVLIAGIVVVSVGLASMAATLFGPDNGIDAIRGIGNSLFLALWIGVGTLALPVNELLIQHHVGFLSDVASIGASSAPLDLGFAWILLIFLGVWITDTGAYLVGRSFGRRKLAPAISPGKSIEGAVGGLILTMAALPMIGSFLLPQIALGHLVAIGFLIGVVGQIGDLFESKVKRACGVKDSSAILPGHGGLLDRFDSLLFVFPAVLVYLLGAAAVSHIFG